MEAVKGPVELALSGKKIASITSEQVEAISVEKQTKHIESSP